MPAPNTATECTLERRLKIKEDARAVRKAVSSSAFIKPSGVPELSRRVREPEGVVDWDEARDGGELKVLFTEDESEVGAGAAASETIFTPVLVLVLAGMNRVACPLLPVIEIRWG